MKTKSPTKRAGKGTTSPNAIKARSGQRGAKKSPATARRGLKGADERTLTRATKTRAVKDPRPTLKTAMSAHRASTAAAGAPPAYGTPIASRGGEAPTVDPRLSAGRSNRTPSKNAPSKHRGGSSNTGQIFSPSKNPEQAPTNTMKIQNAKPTLAATPKPPLADVLPTPMELATLAAALRPDFKPLDAIKTAMEYFLEAKLFVRELPAGEDALLREYGSEVRRMALRARPLEQMRQDVLTLNPNPKNIGSDEVRDFLAANGVNWKTPRTVIDNIRRYGNDIDSGMVREIEKGRQPGGQVIGKLWPFRIDIESELKNFRQESGTYLIPRVLLQGIVDSVKSRGSARARKGAAAKRASKIKAPKTGKAQKA